MALTLAQQTARLARDVDEVHAHPARYFRVGTPSYNRLIEENAMTGTRTSDEVTLSEARGTAATGVTAREITRELRELWPAPITLSTREVPGSVGSRFLVRLPKGCHDRTSFVWVQDYLARHLGVAVAYNGHREIRRHDCGRDVEAEFRIAPIEATP